MPIAADASLARFELDQRGNKIERALEANTLARSSGAHRRRRGSGHMADVDEYGSVEEADDEIIAAPRTGADAAAGNEPVGPSGSIGSDELSAGTLGGSGAALARAAAGVAGAPTGGEAVSRSAIHAEFSTIDTNNDAMVDEEELQAALRQIAGLDPALVPAIAKAIFERADTNHDGKLNMQEFLDLAATGEAQAPDLDSHGSSGGTFNWGWCDCSWCCEAACCRWVGRGMRWLCCCGCGSSSGPQQGRSRRGSGHTRRSARQ